MRIGRARRRGARLIGMLLAAVLATAAGIATPIAGVGTAWASSDGVAVVDTQIVLQKSLAWKSIQRQLDVQRAELTKAFGAQEETLRVAEQELAQQRLSLDPAAFDVKRREFETKVAEARRAIQERTRRLDISFNEARDTLVRTVNDVVAQVARERRLALVLRRDVVLFQSDMALDITETVLQRLNAQLPEVTVKLPD